MSSGESKSYADDTESLVAEDTSTFQRDVDVDFKWTQDWLIKFNINKCVVMHYGHNIEKINLTANLFSTAYLLQL